MTAPLKPEIYSTFSKTNIILLPNIWIYLDKNPWKNWPIILLCIYTICQYAYNIRVITSGGLSFLPPGCHSRCVTKAWAPPIQQGFHGGIAPRGRRSPGPRGSGEAARGGKAPGVIFFENKKMPSKNWKVEGEGFFLCVLFVFFFWGWVGGYIIGFG